ncbi:hypothetical protein PG994_015106 [Apiospora phragmitis]|uniref:Uncharacterized protein n=1 Tax=Apiospora phragmitis TaxID=2905665 RepID=A0ABR1SVJ5_9PEZI
MPDVRIKHHPQTVAEQVDKPQYLLPDGLPLPDELAHLSQEEERNLNRRLTKMLDIILMPIVFILFLLNILDRNNIASAKISGLTTTLGMTNSEYNTCLLMFYVGYCITKVPSNMIIGKVRPALYICLITSLWGILSMSQGFIKNFSQLAAVRFILGLVEAPFLPAVFVLDMNGSLSLRAPMTVIIAIVLLPLLTDYPLQSKHLFLTRELQLYTEYRVRKENAGIVDEDPESIWWGLKQAVIDPKLYMFVVMQMALITAQSFNNFFPSIVGTLGYDRETTLLLTSPPYFFAFIVSLAVSFHAARTHERGYHIAVPMVFALLGNLLAMFVPSTGGPYFSMFLMRAGSYSPYNLCVSWVSASLPRPRAKRAAALAVVNFMAAGVAHFYTPYMFPDSQKARYYAGGTHLRQQNARFEQEEARGSARGGPITYGHIQGSNMVISHRYGG